MRTSSVFSSRTCIILCAVYILAFCCYPLLPATRTSTNFFLWWSSCHSVLGLALAVVWRANIGESPWLLVLLFLAPRVIVFPMMPWLSDDVYRYLWDGMVFVNGNNPYTHAPNTESLAHLRGELYAIMDYKDIPTLYPPLAQLAFGFVTAIGSLFGTSWKNAYFVWKLLLLLSETVGIYYTVKLLHRLALPLSGVALYLCIPLPAIELVGQAHIDGLTIAPLGLFLYTCSHFFTIHNGVWKLRESLALTIPLPLYSGLLAGVLLLLKLTPLVVVLPLFRLRLLWRSIVLASLAGIVLLFSTPFFLYPHALSNVIATARFYTNTLQFNGVLLYSLSFALEAFHVKEWWKVAPSVLSVLRLAVVAVCGLLHRTTTPHRLYSAMLWTLLAVTLLSGKVHVWYFIPILLLNAITGYFWLPAFASATLLTYAIYATPEAREVYTVEYIVWVGAALLAGSERWWTLKRRGTAH